MIIAIAPLLFCLVGLVVWFMVSPSPKPWGEAGRLMYFAGLLVLIATLAHQTWKIG